MADEKKKVDGHRRAIVEHIQKYKDYSHQQDKDFALKTIKSAQEHIRHIKSKKPNMDYSWEDDWMP